VLSPGFASYVRNAFTLNAQYGFTQQHEFTNYDPSPHGPAVVSAQ